MDSAEHWAQVTIALALLWPAAKTHNRRLTDTDFKRSGE